jgi:hypothetical protein
VKDPEQFRHFDRLIWQVPSWTTGVFLGVLAGANGILNNYSKTWGVDQNVLLFLILLSGCIFLFSSSYALYRFRFGQTVSASSAEREKMRRPKFFGAQTFLQLSVTYQFTVLVVLLLSILCRSFVLISVIGVLVMVGMTIYYEFKIANIKKEAGKISTSCPKGISVHYRGYFLGGTRPIRHPPQTVRKH